MRSSGLLQQVLIALVGEDLERVEELPAGASAEGQSQPPPEGLLGENLRDRVINQAFIDHRTRAVIRRNAQGQEVATVEREPVVVGVMTEGDAPQLGVAEKRDGGLPWPGPGTTAGPIIGSVEDRQHVAEAEATVPELRPREGLPQLVIPKLRMTPLESRFQLARISDTEPFRRLSSTV